MFLSHTSELRQFPHGRSFVAAAEAAVSRVGDAVADMAYFTARDDKPADYCQAQVRECDVYVGLIGLRYGSPVRDQPEVSYTELEFDSASDAQLPRLVFLVDEDAAVPIPPGRLLDRDPELQARQRAFRAKVLESGGMVGKFATPEQLELLLLQALQETRLQPGRPGGAATVVEQEHSQAAARQERARLLNERFATAAGQLGHDQVTVQLAGVYTMAGLADDWEENRKTCVDMLCACLRMPYEPDPGPEAPAAVRLAFQGRREVRHAVIRVITAHLRINAAVSWQGLDFDFTGVVFDGGDFSGARFSGGRVTFKDAVFSGGEVNFTMAYFSGSWVDFHGAVFCGGWTHFLCANFTGGEVSFSDATFSGGNVSFDMAYFSGSRVDFQCAMFSGGQISFSGAWFSENNVLFNEANFSGSTVDFRGAKFSGKVGFHGAVFSHGRVGFRDAEFSDEHVYFDAAKFSGGEVSFSCARFTGTADVTFSGAKFSSGKVDFCGAEFSGGEVSFCWAEFSGGEVSFRKAAFSRGKIDFRNSQDWSHPPIFDNVSSRARIKLPARESR